MTLLYCNSDDNKISEGQDDKVIDKAVKKAIAKFHSERKKAKNPKKVLKQKAEKLIHQQNSDLWCPKDQGWWDDECQANFDDLQFLAACFDINLTKAPQNFSTIYPEESKNYFDILAKKRFNSSESKSNKTAKKTSMQRKLEEKRKLEINNNKSDEDLLKEVVEEMTKADTDARLKMVKKMWRPTHKPFWDKECQEAFDKLSEKATSQEFDFDTKFGDYRSFRRKKENKEECDKYFKMLDEKREAFNLKKKQKADTKAENIAEKKSTEGVPNKKIRFNDDGDTTEVPKTKKDKSTLDIDKTIKQIDKSLKKEKKKKLKAEATEVPKIKKEKPITNNDADKQIDKSLKKEKKKKVKVKIES